MRKSSQKGEIEPESAIQLEEYCFLRPVGHAMVRSPTEGKLGRAC
jgi:hypothetical protein